MGDESVAIWWRMNSPKRFWEAVLPCFPLPDNAFPMLAFLSSVVNHMCDITWHIPSSTEGCRWGNPPTVTTNTTIQVRRHEALTYLHHETRTQGCGQISSRIHIMTGIYCFVPWCTKQLRTDDNTLDLHFSNSVSYTRILALISKWSIEASNHWQRSVMECKIRWLNKDLELCTHLPDATMHA